MTFDDGIMVIFETVDRSKPGQKPEIRLKEKERFYYRYETMGITRYYTALEANQQLEAVIAVPGWNDISTLDICVLENKKQYKIAMVQPTMDEDGLKITKLSLERINEEYDIEI